jgi:dienelactone hydrolase
MKKNRRNFIRNTGLAGLGLASGALLPGFGRNSPFSQASLNNLPMANMLNEPAGASVIGAYGQWAAGLMDKKIPSLSFRNPRFKSVEPWKKMARLHLTERLHAPDTGPVPKITVKKKYQFDGLQIEELSWQLPYGPPTDALVLKPANASGKLPGILAFHDHGGLKYFGTKKITRTSAERHPIIAAHQKEAYSDLAWANEIARRGYVVMVADAFPFASRRVMLKDLPPEVSDNLKDPVDDNTEQIVAYNNWAGVHEHTMAKSLYCAGTTWPGVFFAEDKKALDILCARPDVDADKIGCGGLSGGGMRTVFMAGQDDRIKCAVCVGFMTTWKDFLLNKSFTHTWMTYVPLLPNELDFPEILGLRVPLPTMVMNDTEDELYTLSEMKTADNILAEIYKKAGVADHYKSGYYPGPHKFDKTMQADAFNWFDQWLKR